MCVYIHACVYIYINMRVRLSHGRSWVRVQARSYQRLSLCVSMTGNFETALVIGHAAKPRCFKTLPVVGMPDTWKWNKKAWMTSAIFTEWIHAFDKTATYSYLLLDNAPSHATNINLTNVKMQLLPSNTTSILQPLDQCFLQTVKAKYRKSLLTQVLAQLSDGHSVHELAKSVTVLDACRWIAKAVKQVSPITVEKCFAKASITKSTTPVVATDTDFDADDDLPLSRLITSLSAQIEQPMDANDFINIDKDEEVNEDMADG